MQLPGMLVEYLINGSCALIWIWGSFTLFNITLDSVYNANLLLLVPGLYVAGMIVDHLAKLIRDPLFPCLLHYIEKHSTGKATEEHNTGKAIEKHNTGKATEEHNTGKAIEKHNTGKATDSGSWPLWILLAKSEIRGFLSARLLKTWCISLLTVAKMTSPAVSLWVKMTLFFLPPGPPNMAKNPDSFGSTEIILHSPDLGKEYVMRSSRDRIARGAFINTVLITIVFSLSFRSRLGTILPIGITLSVLCFSMWWRFEESTSVYRRRAIAAIRRRAIAAINKEVEGKLGKHKP